jgi:hypothetical protein
MWGCRNGCTLVASIALLTVASGCRTTQNDVERWSHTQQGPGKLASVLGHDKYEDSLRVSAAMTLVSMKPRKGRRIGIEQLLETLSELTPEVRRRLMSAFVPSLTAELGRPPLVAKSGESVDSSIAYKDAAFELIAHEGTSLIDEPELQQALQKALIAWALADFSNRMDAPGQKVGMDQLMRKLGPAGVAGLPELIQPEAPKVDRIVALIAEVGDAQTKERAAAKLVIVATEIASPGWLEKKTPALREANKASGIEVPEDRFKLQLAQFQEEELLRTFASMKRLGGKPSIDYLLAFAQDGNRVEKQRAGALAALEGNLDTKDQSQLERILALAKDDKTPDLVRDLALRRLGEMPRDQVIEPLYKLFENQNWKVRWAAAEHALKMSEAKHLEEFMKRLSSIEHMAISEPLRYGKLIGELSGEPKPAAVVDSYAASSHKTPVRLTALSYYYAWGTAKELDKVSPFAGDKDKVPECVKDAKDCEWKCAEKEVATVGDFVELCIKPAMQSRSNAPAPSPPADDAGEKQPENANPSQEDNKNQ